MQRAWAIAPFGALALLSVSSHWIANSSVLGNAWALAFVACILWVPVLAQKKLWLGYAALFYPFVVLGVLVMTDWGSLSIGF